MKIKGLRVTFKDNDFKEELENFFTDVVKDDLVKFERNYKYCMGDPQRKYAHKDDKESINKYVDLSIKIDDIANAIFNEKDIKDKMYDDYINLVRTNFNEYIDTLTLNDTTKDYLKQNLDILPINKVDLEWQNGEVVYYIFSNNKTLIF